MISRREHYEQNLSISSNLPTELCTNFFMHMIRNKGISKQSKVSDVSLVSWNENGPVIDLMRETVIGVPTHWTEYLRKVTDRR